MTRVSELRAREGEADLHAMAGDYKTASMIMRGVNQDRAALLGLSAGTDPNELRRLCDEMDPGK